MVFEKNETWNFQSPEASNLFTTAWSFWSQRGYQMRSLTGTSFQGRSFQSKLGIHRVVDITVAPDGGGATIQIHFRADVRADVAAGGIVVAVLLLPVAVAGAAISWHEYERDWSKERYDFWTALTTQGQAQPSPSTRPPPLPSSPIASAMAPPPPPPPPAPGAAASAAPAAPASSASTPLAPSPAAGNAVCPSCGKAVAGEGKFCASCGSAIP